MSLLLYNISTQEYGEDVLNGAAFVSSVPLPITISCGSSSGFCAAFVVAQTSAVAADSPASLTAVTL